MKIRAIVGDTVVEGEITHRSESDISVAIVKPYQNLSTGSHIAYFARHAISFAGEYGDEQAVRMLTDLFNAGRHIESQMARLKVNLAKTREQINQLHREYGSDGFDQAKKELRRSLRAGTISNVTYQRRLVALRKKANELDYKVRLATEDFFKSNFPKNCSHGRNEEIFDIIDGKKELLARSRSQKTAKRVAKMAERL